VYLKPILSSPKSFFIWLGISIFIIFYPMLISIYVFLPLLIGVAGYAIVLGITRENYVLILLGSFYLLNLEINLSLPFLLSIISTLFFYLYFFRWTTIFASCRICQAVMSVVLIDILYFLSLIFYDFVFHTTSIDFNFLLFYSVFIDMVLAIAL